MKPLAVLIMLLAAVPCFAIETEADSGNAFVRRCSSIDKEHPNTDEGLSDLMCLAYVRGLYRPLTRWLRLGNQSESF
jgi:hypothetical protein